MITQKIVIEVDESGAIKSIDGLTDAINENTDAVEKNKDANEDNSKSLEKQELRIKKLDGAINLVGGSVEVLAGSLALSGALTDEQAEKFEGAAVGAIALADGSKRVLEGYKTLTESTKIATIAQKAFGIATKIALGPIGLAIVAFGAIAAAVVFLKDKLEIANKVFNFFAGLVNKVAKALGLAKSESEKFREAQAELVDDRQFELDLLRAQGASIDELVKKERELLRTKLNATKVGSEERIAAEREIDLFEAKVAKDKADREQKARDEAAAKRKEAAEKRKAEAEKEAEEEAKRAEEAAKAEADRLGELDKVREEYKRKEEDLAADTEAKKLELQKQRELAELESLGATEEQKAQIIEFYNQRIIEANATANAELEKQNKETADKNEAIAQAEKEAKIAATMSSIDAIQSGLSDLFGESKAIAKANVLIDAAQASVGIFKSAQSIPAPFNAVFIGAQLAALAASSAAAIREINSAEPGSGGGGGAAAGGAGSIPNISQPQTGGIPQIPQTAGQGGVQNLTAVVLAGDVTSAQAQNAAIRNRRRLG